MWEKCGDGSSLEESLSIWKRCGDRSSLKELLNMEKMRRQELSRGVTRYGINAATRWKLRSCCADPIRRHAPNAIGSHTPYAPQSTCQAAYLRNSRCRSSVMVCRRSQFSHRTLYETRCIGPGYGLTCVGSLWLNPSDSMNLFQTRC